MPDNLYFREPSTQNILLTILFIFCKLNPDLGYRQGMHEVLAPIIWVVSRDAIDPRTFEHSVDAKNLSESNELITTTLDANFVEHDSFTVFAILMQIVKSFYELGSNVQPMVTGNQSNSPIVERSKRIHEVYLYAVDPELTKHLTAIEVLPQIFLMYVFLLTYRGWNDLGVFLDGQRIDVESFLTEADDVLTVLEGGFDYSSEENSLSTMFSRYGMRYSLRILP